MGPAEPQAVREDRLARMTPSLSRLDGSDVEMSDTGDAVIACSTSIDGTRVYRDDRLIAVVHGACFWNDPALAQEAAARGASRTAALAFLDRGPAVLDALAGPFSLAIIDRAERRALLATDRLGVEPLYYHRGPQHLVFASKLPAVLAALTSVPPVDLQAVFDYLYFSFVPSPATGWRGCRLLRPAQYLTLDGDDLKTVDYWRPTFADSGRAASASAGELREVVKNSVARCAGRGKIGAFLSGGIDSSTMVGMLTALGGAPVPAFSLGYAVEANSELPYARATARFYGAEHHECYLTPELLTTGMQEIAQASGSPCGNVSAPALLVVTRTAAERGITTMVAGDGGDELFAGNAHYSLQAVLGLWDRIPPGLRHRILDPVIGRLPLADRIGLIRKAQGYVRRASMRMPDRMSNFNALSEAGPERVLSREFLDSIDVEGPLRLLRDIYDAVLARSLLNRMLATDWFVLLHGSDLPRALMACEMAGLRVVFPLLADDVVELSTRIPANRKMTLRRLRTFYVDAFRDFLPSETITKPKQGENVPLAHWLSQPGPLLEYARDALVGIRERGIANRAFVDRLLDRDALARPNIPDTVIYHLVMLEGWFRIHVDT